MDRRRFLGGTALAGALLPLMGTGSALAAQRNRRLLPAR